VLEVSIRISGVRIQGVRIPCVRIPCVRIPCVRIPSVRIPSVRIPGVRIPGVIIPGVIIPVVKIPEEGLTMGGMYEDEIKGMLEKIPENKRVPRIAVPKSVIHSRCGDDDPLGSWDSMRAYVISLGNSLESLENKVDKVDDNIREEISKYLEFIMGSINGPEQKVNPEKKGRFANLKSCFRRS